MLASGQGDRGEQKRGDCRIENALAAPSELYQGKYQHECERYDSGHVAGSGCYVDDERAQKDYAEGDE